MTSDNALVSADLRQYITRVSVLPEQHFDCHKIVLVTFDCALTQNVRFKLPMPAPWSDLIIDEQHLQQGYEHAVSIESWGRTVEHTVDFAYRQTQVDHQAKPWHMTQPLPHKYRGRCQPRHPKPAKPILLTKPGRRSDYNPGEVCRAATRNKVKQVRRVANLCRTLTKYQNQVMPPQQRQDAWNEWQATLRSSPFLGAAFASQRQPHNYGQTWHFAQFLPAKRPRLTRLCCIVFSRSHFLLKDLRRRRLV